VPRIPDSELDRLKTEVSLVRLIEARGIALVKQGKDLAGRCPFHEEATPSLVVSPAKNLFHCFGCGAAGGPIDWVMKLDGVSFRRAVELLRIELGEAPAVALPAGSAVPADSPLAAAADAADPAAAAPAVDAADDAALLASVLDYYHATLKQSPEALEYLRSRGLDHPDLIDTFRLGYANRTLGYHLPDKQLKAGAVQRGALQRIGLLRASGHEHFNGSLVVPVVAPDGAITEVYGRKILPASKLRAGTPLHLYLPGPHRGVFNEAGLVGQEEVILCEALLDALTLWCAGYRNVTSAYGVEGFTDEILAALHRHGAKRVLIAYDADEPGNTAADKLAPKLMAEGFECYRCRFPKGMDANQYAQEVQPAAKSLGLVIRQAEWIGKGAPPPRPEVKPAAAAVEDSPLAAAVAAPLDATDALDALDAEPAAASAPSVTPHVDAEPPTYRIPPTEPPLPVDIDDKELRLTLGDRAYTVRGIEKNLSYEQLKVWLRVSRGDHVHVDTVELYAAKQRAAWLKQAAVEIGAAEDLLRGDLAKLLRAVEQRQDAVIQAQLAPAAPVDAAAALGAAERAAGEALLRDPALIDRIVADVEATGVVGESANALVAYLACVSRKLDKPLAILIQSTSAAGKSTLMDALLALMPESERVHYSAMTGQSLFYLGEQAMKHKILAIAEEEGVRQAAYALKLLQSQGELTIASTGKDPVTGQLVTQEYRVEGPVMLFLTTTAIDIDEELLNRCLVLTIDESREQTAAIQTRQRQARTLDGLLARARTADVLATHRAAQALLRPLAVVNPFAEALTFATDRVRLRRDHAKYLALIDSIALLHQYQRPVRQVEHSGRRIEYVEVTREDIALANRLAHAVLGRSLDELPPQTRRLLAQAQAFVAERAQASGCERSAVRFTRRELREAAGLSDTQLRVHLDRLVALEYVLAHAGRNGQRFVYELAFDGDTGSEARQAVGLLALDDPATAANLAAPVSELAATPANLAGRLRPARGELAVSSRGHESPANPPAAKAIPPLAAEAAETARPEAPVARRRNGASYLNAGA
jgi:DNA primase catalytic core